jgi:DNA modification methylase
MTKTSRFGTGKHESHDASLYYERFVGRAVEMAPEDMVVEDPPELALDRVFTCSSEDMSFLPDNCAALVVTSPNYHVGKESDFDDMAFEDYLQMLERVFAECYRVLEPGGRIAINIANLGRKPYIHFTDLVVDMCSDLGFNARGEIIWQKGKGSSGSCAWGTFGKASTPVLRDLHEYIEVFSKGPFGRVREGESTISKEEFMENTLSVWEMRPASAKRVGHPAPFPVELPARLIQLYTYKGDLVIDPFMGAGTTAIAALHAGRHYLGFEIDEGYAERAEARIAEHRAWVDGDHKGAMPC